MVALAAAGSLYAQPTASMTLTSHGSDLMDGVYVDPYYATVNGVANTLVICDDYLDSVYVGESWTANVYNYSNTSQTQNTTNWKLSAAKQTQDYDEAAYLSTLLLTAFQSGTPVQQGEITFAIWGVFDPNAIPSLTSWWAPYGAKAQSYLNAAASQKYTPNEYGNVQIYSPNLSDKITCVGGPCKTPTPQEFLVVGPAIQTPEAPAPVILAFDLLAVFAVIFLVRRRGARSTN